MIDMSLRTALVDLVNVAKKALAELDSMGPFGRIGRAKNYELLDASISRAKKVLAESNAYHDAWAVLFDALSDSGGVITATHFRLMEALGLKPATATLDGATDEQLIAEYRRRHPNAHIYEPGVGVDRRGIVLMRAAGLIRAGNEVALVDGARVVQRTGNMLLFGQAMHSAAVGDNVSVALAANVSGVDDVPLF